MADEQGLRARRGVVVGAVAVIFTAAFAWRALRHRDEPAVQRTDTATTVTSASSPRDRVDLAFADAERCLIGPALRKGESAAERLRAVELGAMAAPWAAHALPPAERWPVRCERDLTQLARATEDPALGDEQDLRALRDAARASAELVIHGEVGGATGRLWDAAARARVRPEQPGDVPAAPLPAHPIARARLTSLDASGPVDVVDGDTEPARTVRLLVRPAARPAAGSSVRACVSTAESPREMRCTPPGTGVPADGAVTLSFVPADDLAVVSYVLASRPGVGLLDDGLFPFAGGGRVTTGLIVGAFVSRDGALRVLQHDARSRSYVLRDRPASDAGTSFGPAHALPASNGVVRRVALAGGQPVWIERSPDGTDALRALPSPGSQAVTVGTVPEVRLGLQSCRDARGTSVVISGSTEDSAAFFDGTHWSAPVTIANLYDSSDPAGCYADHVTRTRQHVAPNRMLAIDHIDCAPTGCTRGGAVLDLGAVNFGSPRAVAVADVGGRVLLAWIDSGARVWMRMGPVDALTRTPGEVLCDDAPHGGLDATGLALFAREDGAVLVVHTREGSYPVRIDADGSAEPIRVSTVAAPSPPLASGTLH